MLLEAQVINGLVDNRTKRYHKLSEEKQFTIGLPFEVTAELSQKIVEAAYELDSESVCMDQMIQPVKYESNILRKLRENNINIDELIDNSRRQYALKVEEEGLNLQTKNRNDKDHDLINKMAFMSGLLEVQSPGTVIPVPNNGEETDKLGVNSQNPESGRILMRHLTKMFYLNYQDPKK